MKTLKFMLSLSLLVSILLTACAPATPAAQQALDPTTIPTALPSSTPIAENPLAGRALVIAYSAAANASEIVPVDLGSGQPAAGPTIAVSAQSRYAFSNDRTRLAVVAGMADCQGLCLSVLRLSTLEKTAPIQLLRWANINNQASQLMFDPQDQRIAVAYTDNLKDKIAIVDATQSPPAILQSASLEAAPREMAFSPDGKQILLVGQVYPGGTSSPQINPTVRAVLLDAQTLAVAWRQDLPEVKDGFYGSGDFSKPEENMVYQAGMAVDAGAERIYIAHADGERLTTVDFKARAVKTIEIHAAQSRLDRGLAWLLSLGATPVQAKAANNYFRSALLSADGQTLYVVGNDMLMVEQENNISSSVTQPFGLEAWEVGSGAKLLRLDTDASNIRPGPGGKILLSGSDPNASEWKPFSEIFDPATGQISVHADGTDAFTTLGLDGEPLLVSETSTIGTKPRLSVLDENTLQPETSFVFDASYAEWLTYR